MTPPGASRGFDRMEVLLWDGQHESLLTQGRLKSGETGRMAYGFGDHGRRNRNDGYDG